MGDEEKKISEIFSLRLEEVRPLDKQLPANNNQTQSNANNNNEGNGGTNPNG